MSSYAGWASFLSLGSFFTLDITGNNRIFFFQFSNHSISSHFHSSFQTRLNTLENFSLIILVRPNKPLEVFIRHVQLEKTPLYHFQESIPLAQPYYKPGNQRWKAWYPCLSPHSLKASCEICQWFWVKAAFENPWLNTIYFKYWDKFGEQKPQ